MANITRKAFGKKMVTGLGGAALAAPLGSMARDAARAEDIKRPNIVFICSDQHAARCIGYAGHPVVQTPNLDRIARQGVIFTNHYCANPVCAPGRASMMTGMYASDVGSYCNSTVWDGSHPTWTTMLKDAGYYCRATGKLDLNTQFDMGFEAFDTSNGHERNPDITSLFRRPVVHRANERRQIDGRPRDNRHRDSSRAQHAVDFIQGEARQKQQPWALYVGLTEPHPGFVGLKKYYEQYDQAEIDMPTIPPGHLEELHDVFQQLRNFKNIATPIPEERIRRARVGYYAMITELDEYIGQIWDTLEKAGQLDNTVFIYTSDHGESLGEHGMWLKNNLFDVAAKVPLLMAGGGLPKGVTVDTAVGHVDLVATMLEWAGVKRPSRLRGHSLTPLMAGRRRGHPGFAFSESHSEGNATGSYLIRKGDWKYIHFTWYDDLLFNVAEDPGEFTNRIDDPKAQKVLKELRDILHAQINPEEVTLAAFKAQERVLSGLVEKNTEAELAQIFEGRLGTGQARALASLLKGR